MFDIFKSIFPKLNHAPPRDLCPKFNEGRFLPKIVHQTFSSTTLPHELQLNVNQLIAANPEWQHKIYNDADIIDFIDKNYGSRILSIYQKIEPIYGAARADLFRYLLIYKCGGIYLDIKSSATKPLTQITSPDQNFVISQWNDQDEEFSEWGEHQQIQALPGGEFMQWFIISKAGNPLLKAVIDNVLNNIQCYSASLHGVGKYGVLHLTGPIAYTMAIHPLLPLFKHDFLSAKHDLGFQYSVYKDKINHIKLFKNHYSNLKIPIVKESLFKKLNELILKSLLFVRSILKRRQV